MSMKLGFYLLRKKEGNFLVFMVTNVVATFDTIYLTGRCSLAVDIT